MDQKTKFPAEWREIHPHHGIRTQRREPRGSGWPSVTADRPYPWTRTEITPNFPTQGKDSRVSHQHQHSSPLFKATPATHLSHAKGCQLSVLRGRWESIPGKQLTLPSWSQRWVCRVAEVGCTQDTEPAGNHLLLGPDPIYIPHTHPESQRLRPPEAMGGVSNPSK